MWFKKSPEILDVNNCVQLTMNIIESFMNFIDTFTSQRYMLHRYELPPV